MSLRTFPFLVLVFWMWKFTYNRRKKEKIVPLWLRNKKNNTILNNEYFFPMEEFYDEKDYQKELEGENNE